MQLDREQIIAVMQDPTTLGSIPAKSLEEIVSLYPYFEIGHLMLVKKYHDEKHLAFDGQLQKAAIYAFDRSNLYELIHTDLNGPSTEDAAAGSELKEIPSDETELVEADQPPEADGIVELNDPGSGTRAERRTDADFSEDHSFSEWLNLLGDRRDLPRKQNKKEQSGVREPELEIESDVDYFVRSDQSTLDEFLEKNMSKKQPEEDEIDVGALARHSVEPDEDLVTETYAKLLVLQKKYDHAIQAYQKLGLKYPEKSAYFAVRIEEIKKLR